MKRILMLTLVSVVMLAMTACGGSAGNSDVEPITSETTAAQQPEGADAEIVESLKTVDTNNSEPLALEVKEFGYALNGDYLYYAVVLHNPNSDKAVYLPSFRITARDSSGVLLGTEDQTLSIIYPDRDFYYGSMAFSVEEPPETVDIEVLELDDFYYRSVSTLENSVYEPLQVVNTAMRGDDFGEKIVGEIQNSNTYSIDMAVVTIFFRDDEGVLLAGTSTFVDGVSAGGTTPFNYSIYEQFATDNFEVYADNWV